MDVVCREYWMDRDAADKLKELARYNEMSVDDYLEQLIYKEHYINAPYLKKEEN